MFIDLFPRFRNNVPAPTALALGYQRLSFDRPVYVMGDLHGCVELLRRAEAAILRDLNGESGHFVLLGDLIDRGPDSAEVLDHVQRRAPKGITRQVLMGNHEAMFTRFLENPAAAADWLGFGGMETLLSYGIEAYSFASLPLAKQKQLLSAHIPEEHRQFLANLPAVLQWGHVVFAHAGLDFAAEPQEQTEDQVLWRRSPMPADQVPEGFVFVHGHFPIKVPRLDHRVINLDVGAYQTNRSVVLRIDLDGQMALIQV
jgi:serine/threonine protein phosphatase 1